jgi:hypothetical protein
MDRLVSMRREKNRIETGESPFFVLNKSIYFMGKTKKRIKRKKKYLKKNSKNHLAEDLLKDDLLYVALIAFGLIFCTMLFNSEKKIAIDKPRSTMHRTEPKLPWKDYKNEFYKFEIKYPADWADPWEEEISEQNLGKILKVSFQNKETDRENNYEGFVIFVSNKDLCLPDINGNQNTPCPINELNKIQEKQDEYLVYRDSGQFYKYTLLPAIQKKSFSFERKWDTLSDFSVALETFSFDPSLRPVRRNNSNSGLASIGKAGDIAAATKVVNGRRVCKKNNDNPSKSKNNPVGHIDAECCLDPDEVPNSRCSYPSEIYSKMIQKYLASRKN